jgi:hypothetical protein
MGVDAALGEVEGRLNEPTRMPEGSQADKNCAPPTPRLARAAAAPLPLERQHSPHFLSSDTAADGNGRPEGTTLKKLSPDFLGACSKVPWVRVANHVKGRVCLYRHFLPNWAAQG